MVSVVTEAELDTRLQQLDNKFTSQFAAISAASANYVSVPAWAPSQRIDNLSNVTITNANLTASEIPDLSGTYLSLSGLTTSKISEGSNLYYTDSRVASVIAGTTTTALAEGTNLYFTNTRADARINATSTIGTLLSAPSLTTVGTLSSLLATNATSTNLAVTTTASTSALVASNSFTFKNVTGFLKATAGAVATSLINLASDVTGILPVANGGTGWANLAAGTIPYGNGSSALATTNAGTAGQVLALLNGIPTWTATTTLSTISGTLNLSNQVSNTLAVANGGTGANTFGQGWVYSTGGVGALAASTSPTVNYITATSTTATSTFASGLQSTYLNLTGASATSTAANGFNLSGGCFAVNGTCVGSGSGSGTVNAGTQGQFAFYNAAGTTLTATSSLFLTQAGNVGIGTTSPSATLTVGGSFKIGGSTGQHTFAYPTNFSTGELLITTSADNDNVLSLQNNSGTNSFSAVAFRGNDSTEHGAIGYGNSTAGLPFRNSTYIETSNYAGSGTPGTPPDLIFVQSGTLGGGSAGSYARQQFFGSSGDIKLFGKDGTTAGLVQQGTRGVYVGANPTSDVGTIFGVRGDSTSFATNATTNSSVTRFEQTGNASTIVVYENNALTYADGQVRLHLNSGSATSPNMSMRNDGTGTWINYQAANSNNILMADQQAVGSAFSTGYGIAWSGSATDATAAKDTWISRKSAGVVQVGTSAANSSGTLLAATTGIATTSPWRTLSVTGTVGFDGLTGSTGAGSLCLDANRQVVYNSGSDSCLSSTRASKHSIQNLNLDALTLVNKLQPVSFIYNNDASSTVRYGFIAEDAAAVDTHFATHDANGTISGIDDRSIISVLVGAVQHLANEVANLADSLTTKELTFTRASGDEIDVHHVHTDDLCVGSTCVTEDQLKALLASANQSGSASTPPPASVSATTTTPDTTPPTVAINGDNPAHVAVGVSYADLGATVTDNVDHNLGYKTYLNGVLVSSIIIDTSTSTTDTIDYVATDNAGNTATSTRTVIIEAPTTP